MVGKGVRNLLKKVPDTFFPFTVDERLVELIDRLLEIAGLGQLQPGIGYEDMLVVISALLGTLDAQEEEIASRPDPRCHPPESQFPAQLSNQQFSIPMTPELSAAWTTLQNLKHQQALRDLANLANALRPAVVPTAPSLAVPEPAPTPIGPKRLSDDEVAEGVRLLTQGGRPSGLKHLVGRDGSVRPFGGSVVRKCCLRRDPFRDSSRAFRFSTVALARFYRES